MYFSFAAMLLCCKPELMQIDKWSEFAEMIYLKAKAVTLDDYTSKYSEFVNQIVYYKERYNYDEVPVEDIRLDKFKYEGTQKGGFGNTNLKDKLDGKERGGS